MFLFLFAIQRTNRSTLKTANLVHTYVFGQEVSLVQFNAMKFGFKILIVGDTL